MMSKIIDMRTLEQSDVIQMMYAIQNEIRHGWHPHGTVFQEERYRGDYIYYQIMVKYEESAN